MLNPSRTQRLTIAQVEKHSWVLGVFVEEYQPVDERWKQERFALYANDCDMTHDEVCQHLSRLPYGKLGGIFNIEKLMHQMDKITLKKIPALKKEQSVKVINQSRPDQSITN